MAARHLSPGQPPEREPPEREPAERRPEREQRREQRREAAAAGSAVVRWSVAVLTVVVGVLVVVGLQAAARTDPGSGRVSGPASGPASGAGTFGAGTSGAGPSAATPRPTGSSATPAPSPTEDAATVRRAETLMADSERRLGSAPWKLATVLRGRSCTVAGGGRGLQSEWTDEGPASVAPAADLATLDAYWRGLGLATRRTTVSDPTGTFAAVRGDGGAVASIQYSVNGVITTVSACRAPE